MLVKVKCLSKGERQSEFIAEYTKELFEVIFALDTSDMILAMKFLNDDGPFNPKKSIGWLVHKVVPAFYNHESDVVCPKCKAKTMIVGYNSKICRKCWTILPKE